MDDWIFRFRAKKCSEDWTPLRNPAVSMLGKKQSAGAKFKRFYFSEYIDTEANHSEMNGVFVSFNKIKKVGNQ